MKVAIIGSGISGLTSAYYLSKNHEVTVYEKRDRLGGHTATKSVNLNGAKYNVDTGFIVFNDRTYPNFIRLMNELNVGFSETSMGFSVSCRESGLEYAGNNLNTLFAQRKNIWSPSFLSMVKDIVRFNRQAQKDYQQNIIPSSQTLGEYLKIHQYSDMFAHYYLVPMGAAIWSASFASMKQFPVAFFIKFFFNHGLLDIVNRPKWRVIDGGSKSYIEPISRSFKDNVVLNAKLISVTRESDQVKIKLDDGREEHFDKVVFACHSDQALALLGDASSVETEVLGRIPYQDNSVVLHYDESILPKNKKTWSSWNYSLREPFHSDVAEEPSVEPSAQRLPVLTYNMNMLQHIDSEQTLCVTLNADEDIDENKVLGKYTYAHPQFSLSAINAQKRIGEVSGINNTYFCGAYWANGFHEDGVTSAIRVAEQLGVKVNG